MDSNDVNFPIIPRVEDEVDSWLVRTERHYSTRKDQHCEPNTLRNTVLIFSKTSLQKRKLPKADAN